MSTLKAGLIGCGGFAKGIHVPNLKKNPKYSINALADINEAAAKEMAQDTGAAYWTTDVDRLLADPEVDVVVITTLHDSHAPLSIKAANAGKHILCEKPMGLNREECRAIAEAVKRNNVKYTVGYNRGMAPLITKARDLLQPMSEKKMIYHRIQSPFPADHWIHSPVTGGGRFVGEGCHVFDLLSEIIQAPPVSVYAAGSVFLDPEVVKIPDSAIITMTFADGSVGTTLIASAGCAGFPKEATEIYCANKAIYINDFREMQYFGFEGHDRICVELDATDKGHAIELNALADAILNDTESPNGVIKAARAAVISFMAYESIEKDTPIVVNESDYVF